jgi:hypothetical protein
MVDKSQVGLGESLPLRLWENLKIRERELTSLSPELDVSVNLRSPEQIRLAS